MKIIIQKGAKLKKSVLNSIQLKKMRDKAHQLQDEVTNTLGRKIVDKAIKREIKEYSNEYFGSPSFWPWLALYTEIKGEFVEGWLPNDYYRMYLLNNWNPVNIKEISNFKTFYHQQFPGFSVEPVVIKIMGNYYDCNNQYLNEKEVIKLISETSNEVIVKKDGGLQGQDIHFYDTNKVSMEELNRHRSDVVIQPVIEQYSELSELHPESLNTLRIATLLDNDGAVSIMFIFLRFGINGCRVDNAYAGGGYVYLNEAGKVISNAYDKIGLEAGDRHPDTGFVYKNLEVPSVDDAVGKCIMFHNKFPYIRYIAWDVCIDKFSVPRLIEWNAIRPGMWQAEPHVGPIWDLESILNDNNINGSF